MTARYVPRAVLLGYVGQEVTIRRHLTPAGNRSSTLTGRLVYVGEWCEGSNVLPGKLLERGGESAVDLGLVLEVRPATEEERQ